MYMPDALRLLGQVLCTYQLSSVVTWGHWSLLCMHVSYVSHMSLTLRVLQAGQAHMYTRSLLHFCWRPSMISLN